MRQFDRPQAGLSRRLKLARNRQCGKVAKRSEAEIWGRWAWVQIAV